MFGLKSHPLVKYGLVSEPDLGFLIGAKAENDIEGFLDRAIPLCEDNVPLFATLFVGLEPNPAILKNWHRIVKSKRMLIRMARGTGKTVLWTTAILIHRICYATRAGSKHEDPRVLALFGTRERVLDRMGTVRQLIETGGPGGLIGYAFTGPNGEPIDEYARANGRWSDFVIDFPHPRGMFKQDPIIRALAPGMATVGFHPRLILMDDLVGTKQAESAVERRKLQKWFDQDLSPMMKSHVECYVPHTVFHSEDLNSYIANSGEFYLLEEPAFNRMPTFRDFRDIRDTDDQFQGVELTAEGEMLKSCWPCPSGAEADCPATEEHYAEVGFHRPVKDFLISFRRNPVSFAQQYMHIVRSPEDTSIKPWMLRFYCSDPNDRRIGTIAPHHQSWNDWVNSQGLPSDAPEVEALPTTFDLVTHGWDFGYGKSKRNDQTACARLYRTPKGKVYSAFEAGRWGHDQVTKKVVLTATTDPIQKPSVVAIESGGQQNVMAAEIRKEAGKLRRADAFTIKEVRRVRDKDQMLAESGLANLMANGNFYVDIDDEDTINELLSIMPDQSGGHDDRLDAAVNAYLYARPVSSLVPGFL